MKNRYIATALGITESPSFAEASKEELRVLVAMLSLSGEPATESDIARMSGTSSARCRSAIAFWEGAGVLRVSQADGIVEEFEERLMLGEIDEEPSIEVAETIRDENLATLIEECQTLVGTPCLPPRDVKNITALVSQYGMTPEYILTLLHSEIKT